MDCDASNSGPLPIVQWLDPQGRVASISRDLEIEDIHHDAAGVYTYVATSDDGETMSSTVDVIIKCVHGVANSNVLSSPLLQLNLLPSPAIPLPLPLSSSSCS